MTFVGYAWVHRLRKMYHRMRKISGSQELISTLFYGSIWAIKYPYFVAHDKCPYFLAC